MSYLEKLFPEFRKGSKIKQVKIGQIYKGNEGIFTITSYYDDTDYMGEGNYFFDLIYTNGKTECWQDAEDIKDYELIAEYPTWQEAVNSKEFRNE